jgi:tetratricopeptide (TPR) repeat protein
MRFFISYSRSVQDNVRQIIASLRDDSEDVWWDQDLRAGQDWWGTILDNIEQRQVCLFMVSEKAVQSPYCMEELRYILARNRLVLPYIMDNASHYTIPDEIMKGRIQYEVYSGNPNHLKERIRITCRSIDWAQYKDRYAVRPPEPNTGTTNLIDRLDKAVLLAYEGHFGEAVKRFNDVGHNDPASYGEFCNTWIDKINRYIEVANLAHRPAVRKLAGPKWQTFLQLYQNDDFDPLGVQEKLMVGAEHVPVNKGTPSHIPIMQPPNAGPLPLLPNQPSDSRPPSQKVTVPPPNAKGMSAKDYFNRAYTLPIQQHERKIADYTEAIRLNPQYADAYYNRANSHYERKDYARAIADYSEAIRFNPQYATAYNNRANIYHTQKEYERAIADYSEAIRLNPQHALAYYNRANSYYARKEYERATADYTEAIRLNPQYTDAYVGRGNSSYACQRYDQAITDYDRALRTDPTHARAAKNRQLALEGKQKQRR